MNRRTALGRLLGGLPAGYAGGLYAGDAPETPTVRFGMIALTDCAPIVMAHELGLFKKFGIESVISKEASWAAIRDKLSLGENQASHMLLGMPFASTMGLLGSPKRPMVVPWLLNRNGQAITLSNQFKAVKTASELKPFVAKAKAAGQAMTFAMTFPPGTHAMWLRYWLASGGIHPDKDVSLITIPPPQMVANMKIGKMDGFCVGEPWNGRAITDGVGFTVTSTQKIWADHPEKVCAFGAEFAGRNPKTVKAILKALHLASLHIDNKANLGQVAEIISRPAYINCPKEIILDRLAGKYVYGNGKTEQEANSIMFSLRGCNYPQKTFGYWWLSQFRRWGMVGTGVPYKEVVEQVMRPDLYEAAMKELGVSVAVKDMMPVKLSGGVFDPKNTEAYAKSFPIHSLS